MSSTKSAKLIELGALLDTQMPALTSFLVMRIAVCCSGIRVYRLLVPHKLREALHPLLIRWLQLRDALLAVSMLFLAFHGLSTPPVGACNRYESTKVMGLSAVVALIVLMTSVRIVPSMLALCTLKSVAAAATVSMPLAACAAYGCVDDNVRYQFYGPVMIFTTAFSLICHEDGNLDAQRRTVGSTLAASLLLGYYTCNVGLILLYRTIVITKHTLYKIKHVTYTVFYTHLIYAAR